ncbi:MAG TPA: carboxypeptidase-like regulatory domain-containing protein [Bryobacteraceae bacterium]|nr:carboxypeptidase-like regulatory domain-containing protein [Bryobacteraceae bacterium]
MSGRVTADGAPVLEIPVFFWPVGESTRRSLGGPKQLLSSTAGRFEFPDLPPGDYRLLATFDMSEVDEETLDGARAVAVHVDPSQAATADLSPWIAP